MKPLVIFHGNCLDGAGAALAAWLKFGDAAEYRPAQYGDPAPTSDEVRGGREVYILDFSYPRAELERLHQNVCDPGYPGKLVVLDHHKTAQKDLEGLPFCTFNMNKSGAVLAWEYFHVHKREPRQTYVLPELFAYIQDRDLWRWELPHSREISAALAARGCGADFRKLIPIYQQWTQDGYPYRGARQELHIEGEAVLRAEQQMIERIVASAEEIEIKFNFVRHESTGEHRAYQTHDSVRALAVSCPVLQSEVGEALALESARRGFDAVGVCYYRDGKAGKWRVSLRSRDVEETDDQLRARIKKDIANRIVSDPVPYTDEGVAAIQKIVNAAYMRTFTVAPDVSAIAKSFGGGGHHRAAGFECKELPWK